MMTPLMVSIGGMIIRPMNNANQNRRLFNCRCATEYGDGEQQNVGHQKNYVDKKTLQMHVIHSTLRHGSLCGVRDHQMRFRLTRITADQLTNINWRVITPTTTVIHLITC